MASSEKRCHYEVLGLSQDCTPDEIRSAYKKLALQRHPDKLMRSGLSQSEATAQFQELSQAYELLSDPKERAWYDSHRSQILFSDPTSSDHGPGSGICIPNLFSFFSNTVYSGYSDTGKGFFKVFSDVFDTIYSNEIAFCKKLGLSLDSVREAPLMGNLECPHAQVTAFYGYWLGFCTVMDFCWVDEFSVRAGFDRKSRRVMEDKNLKLRKKAKREYNETVRGLADFVKKRDKRVIDMMIKKNAEMERRKVEERERKKKLEKERMERANAYEEPDWARVEEEEVEEIEEEKKENGGKELYCVVCGKKFKSEKQWKNHEQSKKHKEKVAELKHSFKDEAEETDEDFEGDQDEEIDEETVHYVDEMEGRFREGCKVTEEEENGVDKPLDDEEDGFFDAEENDEVKEFGVGDQNGDDDEEEDGESSVLEAMVSGRKSRKYQVPRDSSDDVSMEVPLENVENEEEVMEYNNRKSRRRRSKKDRGKNDGVPTKHDFDERSPDDETNGPDEQQRDESPSHPVVDSSDDISTEPPLENVENEEEVMEYNNRKSRRRRSKKDRGKNDGVPTKHDFDEMSPDDETNGHDEQQRDESLSHPVVDGNNNDHLRKNQKNSDEQVENKGATKKETNVKSKNSSKGKKGKASSKNYTNLCEKCGEEFESRNKLHKHLSDTGHSSLKHR
ncbi:hypothetical protein M5689_017073 [Euphorbia peplus]|nr:hypothetical protein M5689_017073 [Euphorbia peplus]